MTHPYQMRHKLTDDELINHALWKIADSGSLYAMQAAGIVVAREHKPQMGTSPELMKAISILLNRPSHAQCSPAFPCHHCLKCDPPRCSVCELPQPSDAAHRPCSSDEGCPSYDALYADNHPASQFGS